ncbi:T9SS type A sorting domain-containing protein [Flavobacterium sp.]|uniref:T9SS type A sorting domain-containing protein n=1 Tax=Flavobacterium sp. TaxID=239 RepID=UPI00286E5761|nr:T9SS type A sorting domain-containing protein [Flavobacterium sp.]
MKRLKFTLLFCIFIYNIGNAQTWENLTFNDDVSGLNSNPVRGLIPGYDGTRNFPYSMEFFYLPLRNTMNNINSFNWTAFEAKLEEVANRGNTAVVRFYVDYPGRNIATPQFLIDAGITMNDYTIYGNDPNESKSPDYNDPRTMNALVNFIENFGATYNGDPRISIVQGGLVGFWGEWHNYPLSNELGMNDANKKIIFENFISAFPTTKVNIRTPQTAVPTSSELQVGYHDDSFMQSTLGPEGWHFWPQVISAGVSTVWQNHPIGGEIFPDLQNAIWQAIPNPSGQDFQTCVNTTHATYMLNHSVFDDPIGSTTYTNALIQNKRFGYTFHVNGIKLNAYQNGEINIDVRLENRGVAPFYYNWAVELGLVKDNVLTSLGTTNWNIPAIQPNATVVKNFTVSQTLQTGTYTIVMRFVNPLTALKPNAKQLSFANSEQNAHKNGWVSLKTFQFNALGVDDFENKTGVTLYPNPTNNSFTIKSDKNIELVKIYDITGKLLKTILPQNKITQIDSSDLSKGEYLIEIKSDNIVKTEKLIKN